VLPPALRDGWNLPTSNCPVSRIGRIWAIGWRGLRSVTRMERPPPSLFELRRTSRSIRLRRNSPPSLLSMFT